MTKYQISFSSPDIGENEIQEVVDTLKSGWITTGPKTKQFEKNLSTFNGTNRTVCLNSQTACAEMVLRILGVGPGDEVIVPAYTYTATASIVDHVGATIVMVDTLEDSFALDYEQVRQKITKRTKVIIPVDMFGIPCDYDLLYEIVNEKKNLFSPSNAIQEAYGRIVISADCAHSLGATYNEVHTGALADFSSFSFHAVKNLTTSEGGAVTWKAHEGIDDDSIYKEFQLLSLHGQTKDALAKEQIGAWEYDIVEPYFKCNLTDIHASIGLAQLKRYPEMLSRREEIIRKYDESFLPLGFKTPNHYTDSYRSSGHLYSVRIPGLDVDQRQEIITEMAKRGITCNVHYKPLPMLSAYKKLGFNINDFPNAEATYQNLITLPLHTKLSDAEVNYIITSFLDICQPYIVAAT